MPPRNRSDEPEAIPADASMRADPAPRAPEESGTAGAPSLDSDKNVDMQREAEPEIPMLPHETGAEYDKRVRRLKGENVPVRRPKNRGVVAR